MKSPTSDTNPTLVLSSTKNLISLKPFGVQRKNFRVFPGLVYRTYDIKMRRIPDVGLNHWMNLYGMTLIQDARDIRNSASRFTEKVNCLERVWLIRYW